MAQFFKARERLVFPKRCTWADHCTSWPQKPVPFTGHPLHTDTNCGQKPVAPTHKPRYGPEKTPVPQKAAYPPTACALYISLHTQTPTLLRGTPLFFGGQRQCRRIAPHQTALSNSLPSEPHLPQSCTFGQVTLASSQGRLETTPRELTEEPVHLLNLGPETASWPWGRFPLRSWL